MSKKAIFIGPAYPYRGGIAAFNENLATTFQTNGWTCKMFTFTQQYPNFLFPGKNQLATEDSPPNLSIKRGIYSMNPLNWLKISKEIIEEKPDLVITQYWMPFMAPAFGTILRGIKKGYKKAKCVTIVHNFKPHESRIGDKQLSLYISNRTDLLVSLSESVSADIYNSIKDGKVATLFHPIYDHYGDIIDQKEAQQKLLLDPNYKYLLFFGLIRSYKGLDNLINALTLLKTNKQYKLIIAGEFYESEKKYVKLISELGLEDQIIINNQYIPNEQISYYFCAADAIVLPYKSATQSGVVPIAIHFEKPVIVTKVGGLTQLIQENQIGLIAESTPESIGEQIDNFLDQKTVLHPDFSKIRKELSWQTFFDTFMDQLKDNGYIF
ncbi:MAG: glycosyltransferase [Saprospiraceae bacterium]|nr:glycosyltransferase [Bacteroidia bacterium]NNE15284.1 glycosyltransferase [Saprospiraceae bacterium]NNL93563.1 glycosyltransferase [Saprospiraceae bacterium]